MNEYHKIVTVWERDPATKHRTVIEGVWATPEFALLAGCDWVWTEKVDGTNIRVMWDGEKVRFGGKTDAAQIYSKLYDRLVDMFDPERMSRVFYGPACLYGEGYGARIQKGGWNYLPDDVSFCLFDVRIGDLWLERQDVEDVAEDLGVGVMPIVGDGPLVAAITSVENGFNSRWGNFTAEGLVMRPAIELRTRRGDRIITKIKYKDFNHG